jgi:hypothetical protein
MCYSAQVTASFRTYVRRLGARADLAAFQALFEQRSLDPRIKVPKAMEADFLNPPSDLQSALLDRLTHHCHILETGNDSQRHRHSQAQAQKRIKAREQARKAPLQEAEAEAEPF